MTRLERVLTGTMLAAGCKTEGQQLEVEFVLQIAPSEHALATCDPRDHKSARASNCQTSIQAIAMQAVAHSAKAALRHSCPFLANSKQAVSADTLPALVSTFQAACPFLKTVQTNETLAKQTAGASRASVSLAGFSCLAPSIPLSRCPLLDSAPWSICAPGRPL